MTKSAIRQLFKGTISSSRSGAHHAFMGKALSPEDWKYLNCRRSNSWDRLDSIWWTAVGLMKSRQQIVIQPTREGSKFRIDLSVFLKKGIMPMKNPASPKQAIDLSPSNNAGWFFLTPLVFYKKEQGIPCPTICNRVKQCANHSVTSHSTNSWTMLFAKCHTKAKRLTGICS